MEKRPKRAPPPPPGSRDRRKYERYDLLAQVELRGADEVQVCPARNISLGGILLDVPEADAGRLVPGAEVRLFLSVGDVDLATTAMVVRVKRGTASAPRSVGLRWTSEDPDHVARLAQILALARSTG